MRVPSLTLHWEFLAPPVVQVFDGFTGVHSAWCRKAFGGSESVRGAKPFCPCTPFVCQACLAGPWLHIHAWLLAAGRGSRLFGAPPKQALLRSCLRAAAGRELPIAPPFRQTCLIHPPSRQAARAPLCQAARGTISVGLVKPTGTPRSLMPLFRATC